MDHLSGVYIITKRRVCVTTLLLGDLVSIIYSKLVVCPECAYKVYVNSHVHLIGGSRGGGDFRHMPPNF